MTFLLWVAQRSLVKRLLALDSMRPSMMTLVRVMLSHRMKLIMKTRRMMRTRMATLTLMNS